VNIGLISDLAETGFGRVGRELGRRWLEAGHDIRVIGINFDGREGAVARALKAGADGDGVKEAFDSVALDPVLSRAIPAGIQGQGMGHNLTAPLVHGQLARDWFPDRMVVVADPVAMLYRAMTDDGVLGEVPTFNYVPIEGERLSVYWRAIWEEIKPVAMSRFGQREISRVLGRDDVPYVPHGVSPVFFPLSPERPGTTPSGKAITSKEEAKAHYGWEGKTVILRADRYVDRKAYPEYFEVIRNVIDKREDVVFVIHCATEDEGGMMTTLLSDLPGAYQMRGWRHGQVVLTRGHDTFRGLTDAQLNVMYNAADIYATTSHSEGFGLTIAEALAAGTPVVATDFGAITETVGDAGVLVPPRGLVPTSHGHWWADVDIDAFTEALLHLIDDQKARLALGELGVKHTAEYDWDAAALAFLRLMEDETRWKR